MKTQRNRIPAFIVFGAALSSFASADVIPVHAQGTIIDHAPFYSVGAEDGVGIFHYALNHPTFIDIPYVIFDFGAATSVTNANLSWDFNSFYFNSGPATIELYAGSDADGTVTTADRFEGSLIDSHTYTGPEARNYDVTAAVNAALSLGQYFMIRLEAVEDPANLSDYYGGLFDDPVLEVNVVPEPASFALLSAGVAAMLRRRKSTRSA